MNSESVLLPEIIFLIFEYEPLGCWPEISTTLSSKHAQENLPKRIYDTFCFGIIHQPTSFWLDIRAYDTIKRISQDSPAYIFWLLVLAASTSSPNFLWNLCHEILSNAILLEDSELDSLLQFMVVLKVDPIRLHSVLNKLSLFMKKTPRFVCYYLERRQKVLKSENKVLIREFFPITYHNEDQFNADIAEWIISDHYQIVNSDVFDKIDLFHLIRITEIFVDLYQTYINRVSYLYENHLDLGKSILRQLRLQRKNLTLERSFFLKQQRKAVREFLIVRKDRIYIKGW